MFANCSQIFKNHYYYGKINNQARFKMWDKNSTNKLINLLFSYKKCSLTCTCAFFVVPLQKVKYSYL